MDKPAGILETERLRIVPLSREAFAQKRAREGLDPDLAAAMDELSERMADSPEDSFDWLTDREMIRKEDGVCVGSIAYMSDPNYDEERLIEIGYSVDPEYRCRGYATEALAAMTEAGLLTPCADGMIAGVEIGNKPSRRVLRKCGYKRTDRSDVIGIEIWKRLKKDTRKRFLWKRLFSR